MLSSKYSLLTTSVLLSMGLAPIAHADPVAPQSAGASNISISTPITGPDAAVAAAPAPASSTTAAPEGGIRRNTSLINSDQPNYTIEFAEPQAATNTAQAASTVAAAPTPAPQGSALATGLMPVSGGVQQSAALGAESGYVTEHLEPAVGTTVGGSAMTQGASEPSFTFEEQSAAAGTAGAGAASAASSSGALAGGAAPGNVTMGAEGSLQPAVGEELQEVSVSVLGSFDQALTEAFESLESGITLGLSANNAELTVDQIAPAIRGIDTDEMGNLVVRFSMPVTERLLKQKGALSWQGLSNPVLVWMVGLDGTESASELTMVSGQNLNAFAQAILQAAPEYKYRLMFPILDLEDMQKVNVNTVLDHQNEALAEASARYGADYFIAAAISSVPNESGVTLKWNLYNRDGIAIANSALSGMMDEVASLGAGDVARALMTFQKNLDQGADTQNQLKANNVDIDMLGPGEGFVRMRVGNINTLQDINGVRKAFTSYGFDGDTRVVGYSDGQFVIEIATNSNPTNIEGTLRHGGDFTYLAPWTFNFRHSDAFRQPLESSVGPASPSRPNSQLSAISVTTPAP